MLLSRMIARLGFAVRVAGDGREGVALANDWLSSPASPQVLVIFMDYNMPVMDGPSATEALVREHGERVRVYGVTGNAHKEDRTHFIRKGALEVLTKPVTKADILLALQAGEPASRRHAE